MPALHEYKPGDRRRVGQAVGEAERVVDVVDVAARDPEVLLDLLRRQRERVDHELARAGREAIADREQVLDVAPPLPSPRSCRRRARTAPTARRARSCGARRSSRSDRIDRRVDVPLDGRELGEPPRLRRRRSPSRERAHDVLLVGQEVDGRAELARDPRARQVNFGRPRSARFTLNVVPSRGTRRGARCTRRAGCRAPTSVAHAERVGVAHDRLGAAARRRRRARRRARVPPRASDRDATLRAVVDVGAGVARRVGDACA